ncbi:E3 ubiquitin-protein ligase makorin-like isoform X2 [Castanea sativa]|uniref:E3 ubiquitin-protein ligase makorin-like isoform X2 n=1 Tax=Castanea sativa TaxID=21020 RepID=UPI003F65123E
MIGRILHITPEEREEHLKSCEKKQKHLRACPICCKLSYFVIPSVIWYSSKEEKQDIVDSYKAKLKSIDCKHFDFGNGNCPFGSSCFYKHKVKPGSNTWRHHRPPP